MRARDLARVVFPALLLCVQRQAAAVRMFLRFFGFGVFAFEVSERYVQRFVA